jgi:hypothetical protein
MNKLGIFLVLVMILGSTPLGFSDPLRVQLEEGIETDQLQCDNIDHVLVLRTNGKMACVTEKTFEKMNWKIFPQFPELGKEPLKTDLTSIMHVNQIKQINYEYPLSTNDFKVTNVGTSEEGEYFGEAELIMSNLPNIGETAELTYIVSDVNYDIFDNIELPISVRISDNFEFVDLPQENIVHTIFDDKFSGTHEEFYDYQSDSNMIPVLAPDEIFEFTFTIRAVSENSDGVVSVSSVVGGHFKITVLEDQTLLRHDFVELYPELALALMPVNLLVDDNLGTPGVETTITDRQLTAEEIRETMESNGYSEEEIIEAIAKSYPELSTQN